MAGPKPFLRNGQRVTVYLSEPMRTAIEAQRQPEEPFNAAVRRLLARALRHLKAPLPPEPASRPADTAPK